MLHRLREIILRQDRGLILIVLLSLAAAWPFLLRASLPRETDAELHVFRAAELGYSLRALELYPRWAPDFYYGYGYPIFNYYAPLTYYLANVFSLAIPSGVVFGTKLVFIATFLMAGTGTYKLASLYAGKRAGLIAASSYLFAPYLYIIDSHLRGDLAEFLALGIAPLALWVTAAFQHTPTRGRLIFASLISASLILSHNLLGLAFYGLLVGQWLWLTIIKRNWSLSEMRSTTPLIFAVCLSTFFWLPVALESNAVQLHNLVGPGHFDFREHFLTPAELFLPNLPLDLGSMNPAFRYNLGLAQWLLGVLGLVAVILHSKRVSDGSVSIFGGIFWLICTLILILLMFPVSQFLWESIPIMPFFQFPWRLLGPAGLCLALLGGYSALLLPKLNPRTQSALLGLAVVLPILSALPIWSPPAWEVFGATDQAAMMDFELSGFALGTTSTGDFVPSTVDVVPPPTQSVVDSYRNSEAIDRVAYPSLPSDVSVTHIDQRPTSDRYHTRSSEAFTLQLYRFIFPGWKATVDGQPVELRHTEPEGFIQIPVPAGEHEVHIWFGLTPPRIAATVLSVLALTLLGFVAYFPLCVPTQTQISDALKPIDIRGTAGAISVVMIIATAGTLLGLWQPRSTGLIAIPAETDTHHYFEGGIDFIGYDIDADSLRSGDELPITLYWKAREPVPANYQVFVHLTTVPEHIWGQSDKLNPGDYPTTRWALDKYLRDPHSFTIPIGTPAGMYEIRVGLWNRSTGQRQLLLEEDGTVLGDSLVLPTMIKISTPRQEPSITELPLDTEVNQEVVEGITLLGADLDPEGEFQAPLGHLAIRLYWLSSRDNLRDYHLALRLVAADGSVLIMTHEEITDGLFPTTDWDSGSVIRDIHTIWFDQSIPTGSYHIELALTHSDEVLVSEWIRLTEIQRQ